MAEALPSLFRGLGLPYGKSIILCFIFTFNRLVIELDFLAGINAL